MASRIRRLNKAGLAAVAAVVLIIATALSSLAADKTFTFAVSPTSVAAGTQGQVLRVTVTNTTPSATINSFSVVVPSQFAVQSAALSTTKGDNSNPNASVVVSVNPDNSQEVDVQFLDPIKRNQKATVAITTNVTSTGLSCGTNTSDDWTVTPYTGSNLSGSTFGNGTHTTSITNTCSLSFTVQPSDVAKDTVISPFVKVSAPGAADGTQVSLSISPSATISGNTAGTSGGVATFSSLKVVSPTGTYTLTASATNFTSATSNPFTVFESTITCGQTQSGGGTDVTLNAQGGCSLPITITSNTVNFPTAQDASSRFTLTIAWGQPESGPYSGFDTFTVNGQSFTPGLCDVVGGQAQYPDNPDGSGNFWPAGSAEQPWCVTGSSLALHDFGGSIGTAYQATEQFLGAGDPSITRH